MNRTKTDRRGTLLITDDKTIVLEFGWRPRRGGPLDLVLERLALGFGALQHGVGVTERIGTLGAREIVEAGCGRQASGEIANAVVALEEHFTVPAVVRRIDPGAISRRGFRPRKAPANGPNPLELLPDIGERRLKSMDEAGITAQVLSNSDPGPDLVPGPDGVAMARDMNDHLATATSLLVWILATFCSQSAIVSAEGELWLWTAHSVGEAKCRAPSVSE